MPTIYITLFDHSDQEILLPYTYRRNGKKRKKLEALKPTLWQQVKDCFIDGIVLLREKKWRAVK
jgi:hypothetical protein